MSEHLATDGAGNILLSGSFTGMASFGGATLVDQGNGDRTLRVLQLFGQRVHPAHQLV